MSLWSGLASTDSDAAAPVGHFMYACEVHNSQHSPGSTLGGMHVTVYKGSLGRGLTEASGASGWLAVGPHNQAARFKSVSPNSCTFKAGSLQPNFSS